MSEVDNLLDSTLDDLEDLPEFKVFPVGAHRCTLSFEEKEVSSHKCIEVKFKALETLELADHSDTPLNPNDESSTLYMLDNEFGRGKLKKLLASLREQLNIEEGASLRTIMETSNNLEVVLVSKLRTKKGSDGNPDQQYMEVVSVSVV